MGKTKVLLSLAALLLAACGDLTLPGLQPKPFTGTLDTQALQTVAPGGQVQVPVRAVFNDPKVDSLTLTVRLADPCAKGTSNCPGWDTSRYPGVTHPTGSLTLTPASPAATLTFQAEAGALPQGPFKYELVLSGEGTTGKAVEEVLPFYLKIRDTAGRPALEALADWRARAGLPGVQEDPEWSWRAWLHGRYKTINALDYQNNTPSHDEDLSQPFATPEGQSAARIGNESGVGRGPGVYVIPDEYAIHRFISAPFHRFNMIEPQPLTMGFGSFRKLVSWQSGSITWAHFNMPNPSPAPSSPREVRFPAPGMEVPLNRFDGGENPDPLYPCANPSAPPERPYLTQEGLTWYNNGEVAKDDPRGLPITVMTFAKADTKVLEARVKRLSDGAVNPVCAYGSRQYWEDRKSWRDRGINILNFYGAFIVFPHEPLDPGKAYEVYLKGLVGGQPWEATWTFHVAPRERLFRYNASEY